MGRKSPVLEAARGLTGQENAPAWGVADGPRKNESRGGGGQWKAYGRLSVPSAYGKGIAASTRPTQRRAATGAMAVARPAFGGNPRTARPWTPKTPGPCVKTWPTCCDTNRLRSLLGVGRKGVIADPTLSHWPPQDCRPGAARLDRARQTGIQSGTKKSPATCERPGRGQPERGGLAEVG